MVVASDSSGAINRIWMKHCIFESGKPPILSTTRYSVLNYSIWTTIY